MAARTAWRTHDACQGIIAWQCCRVTHFHNHFKDNQFTSGSQTHGAFRPYNGFGRANRHRGIRSLRSHVQPAHIPRNQKPVTALFRNEPHRCKLCSHRPIVEFQPRIGNDSNLLDFHVTDRDHASPSARIRQRRIRCLRQSSAQPRYAMRWVGGSPKTCHPDQEYG